MQLTLEQGFDFLEALERNLGHIPEVMPVMAAMLAVVTQHSPIVPGKDRMIDVCQVVPNDIPRFVHPRFDPDLAVSTAGGDCVNLIDHLFQSRSRHDGLYHP